MKTLDEEAYIFLPPYSHDSKFYPATREWHLSPKLFSEVTALCAADPDWPLRNLLSLVGAGPIRLVVVIE